MKTSDLLRGSFEVERTWRATPETVFSAWSDPAVKAQWFRGPPGHWTEIRRSMDFSVGGIEIVEGRFDADGETTLFTVRHHVIEPPLRIAAVFDLHLSGIHHSVTLASLQLTPTGETTRVSYCEQITFLDRLDGVEMRREGTEWQFDIIGKIVEQSGRAD